MSYISKTCLLFACMMSFTFAHAATPDAAQIQKLVDSYLIPYTQNHAVPGAAVAIYVNGQDYYFTYGVTNLKTKTDITKDTLFEIASDTKVFTSTLLAYELGQGKIGLDDSIADYLPPLNDTVDLPIDTVTPQDLATHTASFPRDLVDFGLKRGDMNGFLEVLKTWQPSYPIGTKYAYSNIGFGLLGTVIQNASGQSYQALLQQVILTPLQMNNTYIYVPSSKFNQRATGYNLANQPVPYFQPTPILGGGELVSSAADLLQFVKANLNIAPNSVSPNLLTSMRIAQQPVYKVTDHFYQGLGWESHPHTNGVFITKDGMNRGFTSFIAFVPNQQMGIVILFNKKQQKAIKIGTHLLQRLIAINNHGTTT